MPARAGWVALAGWVAFATYLLVQARAGPVIIWNDSKAYEAVAARPLWSHGFWWGQRPPVTPLLIKAFGTGSGLLSAQALLGAAAWGTLAWTVGRMVEPGWRRLTATWLVLGFATALPITMWNRSMLSESVSLSLLVVLVAGLLGTARRATWPRVLATSATALALAGARDAGVWTVVLLGTAVAALALARTWSPGRATVRAGALAACLLVVAGGAEWGTLASHRTTQDAAHVFFVRVFPFPARVAWFAGHGMPEQRRIDQLADTTTAEPGTAKVVYVAPGDPAFRPLEAWLTTDGTGAYLEWLATHPWYVVTEPLVRPERSYNFARGSLAFYAPAHDDMASPLASVTWPPLVGLALLGALAVGLAVRDRAWRLPSWRMVVVVAAVGLAAVVIAWNADGQEVTRHTVEGFAEVRLGAWILAVLGLVGAWSGPRRARPTDLGREPAPERKGDEVEPARARELTSQSPSQRALNRRG